MRWDLFCRVIDNFGDIGVCWRLAADLANRGDAVRLWTDDASALAWMAPHGAAGVEVRAWADAGQAEPAEVVVEAFGCDPPDTFVARMAARTPPPRWINLEYLSAEPYVARSHRLPSPQLAGPGRGLTKHFFYPGFSARTGGLLREPDLAARQQAFDAPAWLAAQHIDARPGERRVSLFCYANPALPALLDALTDAPTLLLVTPGLAAAQVQQLSGGARQIGALRLHALPYLTQHDYDHLLWACDLNFVRGEDSFVRAQWAGRPFIWQIYPQHDGVHAAKRTAFEALYWADAEPALAAAGRAASAGWNGEPVHGAAAAPARLPLPPAADRATWDAWATHARRWRTSLAALPDLTASLRAFAAEAR
jgi:uncharacterized repeat protein (TIGR03837 family)